VDSAPVVRAAVSGTPVAAIRSSGADGTGGQFAAGGSGSSTLATDRHAAALKRASGSHGGSGRGSRDDHQSGGSGRDGTGPGGLAPGTRENSTKSSGDGGDSGTSTQGPSRSGSSGASGSGDSGSGRSDGSGRGRGGGDSLSPVHASDSPPPAVTSSSGSGKSSEPVDPPKD